MPSTTSGKLRAISFAGIAACMIGPQAADADVTYNLPESQAAVVYPNNDWLPDAYQQYYSGLTLEDVVQLFTESSLKRDGIAFDAVTVKPDGSGDVVVTIDSNDSNAALYESVHPQFIANNFAALQGARKCMDQTGCWNKNNTRKDQPWAFFPQFGLPMAMQRSVLMLNYPPATALTGKDYLDTFTMKRWTRVLSKVGIDDPTLYETIVDVRPIAAPGSGTSSNLPDAQTYFNDPTGKTGGYYINPQLALMLDANPSSAASQTLPLVVLGTPARETWGKITGTATDVLTTGTATIPGAAKPTPFILGNHPDVTTYQCCPGDPSSQCKGSQNLIKDEEVDVRIACWAQGMSKDPGSDPSKVLAACTDRWVTSRSAADDLTFCALARMDSNECFDSGIEWDTAINFCKGHNNDPCATYECPSNP